MLDKEFKYYIAHQEELLQTYKGKFIVIKDEKVQDAYDSLIEAYASGLQRFEAGTFLIQECLPGKENYTQTYHNRRVSFSS